jgi:hypothetical protein
MPVTLRRGRSNAAAVMIAKWCLSRGEKVTLIVPTDTSAAELSSQFTREELASVTFSIVAIHQRTNPSL